MTTIDDLAASKYLSLTTFRRSGEPVATPVWVTREGDRLYVITGSESGKVKRLRHTQRVLLAPCDARGTLRGEQVEGTARILDAAGTGAAAARAKARYGLTYRVLALMERVRSRAGDRIGLQIVVGAPAGG
jgi:PPOX class probable F420-dependent enzyme